MTTPPDSPQTNDETARAADLGVASANPDDLSTLPPPAAPHPNTGSGGGLYVGDGREGTPWTMAAAGPSGAPYAGVSAPPPPPFWGRVKPLPLPTTPVEFQQMLRTPRHRWWKPLLTLLLFVGFAVVAINLGSIGVIVAGVVQGRNAIDYLSSVLDISNGGVGPVSFAFINFSLIVLIPLAMAARWIVTGQRPRFLSSVAGGIRWGWLSRCLAVTVPIWLVYVGITTVLDGSPAPRPGYWGVLLALVLLTTPFQCAGEEYTFRGLVLQAVGSWFRRPGVALVVGAVPAVALFAAAHGSPDPYILTQLVIFGTACVIVTWRTGGLEGAIAIHIANNVVSMAVSIIFGGWGEGFIDSGTKGSLLAVLVDLVVLAVAVALILWQAKQVGLSPRYVPGPPRRTAEPLPTGIQPA